MSNRMSIDFKGVDQQLQRLKQYEGAAQRAVDEALKATQSVIADKAEAAMQQHNRTGITADQLIRSGEVVWTGDTASIAVGFKISDGDKLPGLPSIFIMYGTEKDGQPSIEADKALYDAVYGTKTRKEIRTLQQAAFNEILKEVTSG